MIVDDIYEWAKRKPEATALIWNDVSVSYRAFSNAIQTACDFFTQKNLPVGRTAIVLVNSLLDAWIVVMALRAAGLNTISVPSIEGAESLRISDAACVITTQPEAAAHNLTLKATKGMNVIALPPKTYSSKDTSELLTVHHDNRPFGGHIVYTSGTTGRYKKVMMSGEQEDRRNHMRAQFLSIDKNTIYHGTNFGLWTSIGFKTPSATWYSGGCVIFDQRKDIFENFFLHGATFAMFIPGMLKQLVQTSGASAGPIAGFSAAVGGGALSIDLAEQTVQKLTTELTLQYSSTEINSTRLRSRYRTKDDLHWFLPTDERLFQIVDEKGKECSAGQEGELRVVLSDIDCHKYLDDEEASARVFRDGFFYPGDMAVRREDGRIRILGRNADVVVLNAQKVAAVPIEQAIQRFLGVEEVCLFSGLSEKGHELIIVAIQSDRPVEKTQLKIAASKFVRSERVNFSIFRQFPRTEIGMRKTKRALLKKIVFEQINKREC